jgi:large subunit ribosomal protein L29
MAVLRTKEIKKLGEKDLDKKLSELRLELTKERANIAIGASATSPGRIKEIRRAIARINTVKNDLKRQTKGKKESGVKTEVMTSPTKQENAESKDKTTPLKQTT